MSVSVTRREALFAAGAGAAALAAAGCVAPEQRGNATTEPQVASVEPLGDTSGWDATFYEPAYGSVE